MGDMQCSMNMLFTWSTENLCIVFPQWRVTGTLSLIFSIVAVIAITAGYEALRAASRRYEAKQTAKMEQMSSKSIPEQRRHAHTGTLLMLVSYVDHRT